MFLRMAGTKFCFTRYSVALVALVAGAARAPASQPARAPRAGVRPVPSESVLVAARKDLREKFVREYADASEAGKRRLAGFLMREAASAVSDGPLYVALLEARDLAVAAGEVELALVAAGEVGRKFDVDPESVRYATLAQCAQRRLTPSQAAALSLEAKGVADERLADDDFDGAYRAASLAEEVSRKSGDPALQGQLALAAEYLRDLLRQVPKYREAMVKLEGAPDDPKANQTAGEFLAIAKQEWGRGLVKLSKGTDALLRAAAEAELGEMHGTDLGKAAEAWARLAETKTGPSRATCAQHARMLFERAAVDLEGKDKDLCIERAGAMVNALPGGTNLADGHVARMKLGDLRYAWFEDLRLGGAENREDDAKSKLKNSQVEVAWHPRVNDGGEIAVAPEGSGDPSEARLTYRVDQLVVDDQGHEVVLQVLGKVPKTDPAKPVHLRGAAFDDLRRLNANKATPAGVHVEVYLDGVKVYERATKLPVKRAWWLDDRIARKAGGRGR